MRVLENPGILQAILESLHSGVYFVGRDQKILFWNEGAERITGYLRQDVIGRLHADNFLGETDGEDNELTGSQVDPLIPVGSTRSMEQVLSRSLALRNFMRMLLSSFAILALLLAAIGIYGVISYAVSQRTREIGVRMALGATPSGMLSLILAESLQLIFFGVLFGVAAAFGLTRMLASMLYGVTSTDPLIFVSVTLLLIVIALAACLIPARRAMRIDPMVALRHE